MKWIGQPTPKVWPFKNRIPRHADGCTPVKVDFPFSRGYILIGMDREVLMPSGEWMPTVRFCLKTPGWVIGPQDMQAPGNLPWAHEWRQALADWREDQIKLRLASNPQG